MTDSRTSGAAGPPAVGADSRLHLFPLARRRDGDAWIIGRIDSGDFITIPDIGRRAIDLLDAGHTVHETAQRLAIEAGDDVDVADFAGALTDAGLVRAIDDQEIDLPPVAPGSLPWLRPRHVAWTNHPLTACAAAVVIICGLVALATHPNLIPGYRDLLWNPHGTIVLIGNAAIGWTLILIHELAHLGTARGVGVPARMSLSTRLQYLAAQTDASGIWAAPRRARLTCYLAGITVNLLIAAIGVSVQAAVAPGGLAGHLLAATVLISLLFIPSQFMVFMRTDLYFVLQDLTGSANLYRDGARYLRYLLHRLTRRPPATDPTRHLPPRERRAIRAYCLILAAGVTTCLTIGLAVTLPVAITLLIHAITTIATGGTGWPLADAITLLAITATVQSRWLRAWWRRHAHQARAILTPRTQPERR